VSQVFPPGANALVRWSIVGLGTLVVLVVSVASATYWSPVVTQVNVAKEQPVPFSHARHVIGNGMDCRYCHTTVETSHFAGIPATETCMTCRSQILNDQPMFNPVNESWNDDTPMEWTRVSDLPDFVYFDHSVHVKQGIGCSTCHGPVDEMTLTWKAETFHMSWCIRCHRAPEKFIRPRSEVFNMAWDKDSTKLGWNSENPDEAWNQAVHGPELVKAHNIQVEQLRNCSICHR
jgi:hypothetical protein